MPTRRVRHLVAAVALSLLATVFHSVGAAEAPTWATTPAVSHRGQEAGLFAEVLAIIAAERGTLPATADVARRWATAIVATRPAGVAVDVSFDESSATLEVNQRRFDAGPTVDLASLAAETVPLVLETVPRSLHAIAVQASWYLWFGCVVDALGSRHDRYLTVDELAMDTAHGTGRHFAIGLSIRWQDAHAYVTRVEDPDLAQTIPVDAELTTIDGCPIAALSARELLDYWYGPRPFHYTIEASTAGEALRATAESIARREGSLRAIRHGDTLYVRIDHFATRTIIELRRALRVLTDATHPRVILDLRGNPGGSLALDLVDCFLPPGQVLASYRDLLDDDDGVRHSVGSVEFYDYPLAVLVDRDSASMSEVFAAAMQTHHRALLIGEATFGKAVAQRAHAVLDEGRLWLVDTMFYYPGTLNSWTDEGVCPAIGVILSATQMNAVGAWLDGSDDDPELPVDTDPALHTALELMEER